MTAKIAQTRKRKMTIKSRYESSRKVTDNGHGWYTMEGVSRYYRVGMTDDNSKIAYVDYEGGPFLHIGDDFEGHGKILSFSIEKAPEHIFKVRIEVEQ